jgi:hypothetical protein
VARAGAQSFSGYSVDVLVKHITSSKRYAPPPAIANLIMDTKDKLY